MRTIVAIDKRLKQVICDAASMSKAEPRSQDAADALDDAKRRLMTSSRELLETHLAAVGQQRVDDELKALSDAGVAVPGDEYRVVLTRGGATAG